MCLLRYRELYCFDFLCLPYQWTTEKSLWGFVVFNLETGANIAAFPSLASSLPLASKTYMWKKKVKIGTKKERDPSLPHHLSLELCKSSPTCELSAGLGMKGKKWVMLARTAHNVFVKIMAFQTVKTMLAERMYYSECSDFFFVEREGNTFKIDLKWKVMQLLGMKLFI